MALKGFREFPGNRRATIYHFSEDAIRPLAKVAIFAALAANVLKAKAGQKSASLPTLMNSIAKRKLQRRTNVPC